MRDQMIIENHLPADAPADGIRLGLIMAAGVDPDHYPGGLEEALKARIEAEQRGELPSGWGEEARRAAARDMLRNGIYKPTGRGKPASEYLVRAAREGQFPRINALVDINNLISLEERLPISLWDLDRAGSREVIFRLGREGESYAFNASGQEIDVRDLAVGCAVRAADDRSGEPMVSPIKDSQLTKTHSGTRAVAAAIYAPCGLVTASDLALACERFGGWLAGCGNHVRVAVGLASPGETVVL